MGIMPDPITPGLDCVECFPAGATPTLVKCFFSGIERGERWVDTLPPPPKGYYDLIQNIPGPCDWSIGPSVWTSMIWAPVIVPGPYSRLQVRTVIAPYVFSGNVPGTCKTYFVNGITNYYNNWYYGGQGFVATPALMQSLIEMVTPITGPNPRMELYPMENELIVLKFCNVQDGTNIKIKLDTALL